MSKILVTELVTREIDTDKFTLEQWKEFIMKWCRMKEVEHAKRDLFPFEALKARAVANAKMSSNPFEL